MAHLKMFHLQTYSISNDRLYLRIGTFSIEHFNLRLETTATPRMVDVVLQVGNETKQPTRC